MPRQKGDGRGNQGGGRRPGTPNKTTQAKRELLAPILLAYINGDKEIDGIAIKHSLVEDLNDMEPEDRARIVKDMMPYVMPRLANVEVKEKIIERTFQDELDELSTED